MARTYDFTGTIPTSVAVVGLAGSTYVQNSLGVTVSANTSVPSFSLTDNTSNPLTNETDQNQWLVVRASHNAGTSMGVVFGPVTIDYNEPNYSFPIRGDGEMHTYNLWLGRYYLVPRKQLETEASFDPCINEGPYPGFIGNQSKMVLQNSALLPNLVGPITVFVNNRFANHDASGSWGRVEFIKIADRPEGPTVLIIDMLCCARAICRVDEPTPCGIRIRNMGSVAATGIQISFTSVSPEVTCGEVYGIPDSIPAGEERTAYFMFTCTDHSAFFSVDVTVTCIQPDSVTKRLRVWVDDTAPAFTPNVVPTPQIIPFNRKKSRVCVWYFAVWSNSDMFHTCTTISSFERRLIDGYGNDNDPNTLAWHIYYLVSRGVDVLAVEWFDHNQPTTTNFVNNSLMQCGHLQYVKFLFSYINHDGTFLSSTTLRKNPLGNTPTMRNGAGAPVDGVSGTGVEYDFYRDTTNRRLYGPKGPVNWPTTYVQFPTTSTHGDALLSSNTDRRLIYCANFISLIATWCPYLAHPQYSKNASGQRELWIYFGDQFYDQVNNLSGVIEATRYSDNRDALMGSLLDRAEAVILDYGLTGGVEWGCPVNRYQGGSGLDSGPLLNSRYKNWGFKKSSKYNFYAGGSRYQRMSAEVCRAHYEGSNGWPTQANENGITPALAILAGFGNHRWNKPYGSAWVVDGWSYEHMLGHCQAAMAYQTTNVTAAHGHPSRDLIIDAATEPGEGSMLIPSAEYQTKLGDALFEAVVSGVAMLPLLSPNDVYTSAGAWPARIANIHDWAQFPTAEPEFNSGETHTKQGITIPLGLSPAVEPADAVGGWIET